MRADLAERLVSSLSQVRRGSETSAFVVPPELAAQVGCPIADFPAILRALGLKPAEKDKETGAVKLWRFASQRQHAQAEQRDARPGPPPSGPFAMLADLVAPAPVRQRRRRKQRPKSALPAATPKPAA